ncbi:hypothetical protein P7H22_17140 [Paenibacillus larvae]|nr:hypothetical protein [Paenibacillus larvae]MDT2241726.1 hypothetical protein [Paenibacillus larvae]
MRYPYSYTYEVTSLMNKKVDQALNEFKEIILLKKDLTMSTSGQRGEYMTRTKKLMCQKNWMIKNKPTIIAFSEFKKWAHAFGRNVEPKLGIGEAIKYDPNASLSKKLGFEEKQKTFSLVAGKETVNLKIIKSEEYSLKNNFTIDAVVVPDQIYQKALQVKSCPKDRIRLINVKDLKNSSKGINRSY